MWVDVLEFGRRVGCDDEMSASTSEQSLCVWRSACVNRHYSRCQPYRKRETTEVGGERASKLFK